MEIKSYKNLRALLLFAIVLILLLLSPICNRALRANPWQNLPGAFQNTIDCRNYGKIYPKDSNVLRDRFGFAMTQNYATNKDTRNKYLQLNLFYGTMKNLNGLNLGLFLSAHTKLDYRDCNGQMKQSLPTTRGISINGIGSEHGNFTGIAFASFVNEMEGEYKGISITGFMNQIQGDYAGISFTGLINEIRGESIGIPISFFANEMRGNSTAISLAGFVNRIRGNYTGISFSSLINYTNKNFNGISLAFITLTKKKFRGINASGISEMKEMQAASLSAVHIIRGKNKGLVVGAFNSVKNNQFFQAGVWNSTKKNKFLQLGLVNTTKKNSGLAIGLINYTNKNAGIQLGILNIAPNSWLPIFPIINFSR
ncbi:MAG: hypothetical protein AAF518_24720 [Spirochaetota bacterium]